MRTRILLILITSIPFMKAFPQAGYFSGYEKSLSGEVLAYHSPDPGATTSLLVRSIDSTRVIRWVTEKLPAGYRAETASFVWMYGLDVNPDSHGFFLEVNGTTLFRFANPLEIFQEKMVVEGPAGSRLEFRRTLTDKYGDVMGYAILTLPRSFLEPGKSIEISVHGESANSRSWYMTFERAVSSGLRIVPEDLVINRQGKPYQSVRIDLFHLGGPTMAEASLLGESQHFNLQPGYNGLRMFVPEVRQEKKATLRFVKEGEPALRRSLIISPPIHWTLYLVQHTHTDIGYTRPQSTILPEHLRFIDLALDLCDQTDSFPDDARFRWTCETSWAVKEYLETRPPEQTERLKARIAEGRIEVTGMLFNFAEIADEAYLAHSLLPLREFHREGIPVRTAMQDDVNGIGWCMADYFPDTGIRYLIMGEHGHRALIPFACPTPFWWESPSGSRVLAFRGEHYMHGNQLGIHAGDMDRFRLNLMVYLRSLREEGYPYDRIGIQYSGYVTDNSPPATSGCEMIREWNKEVLWPGLRSATASEFMADMEQREGQALPVYRLSWPDWWTDGTGSAIRETSAARRLNDEILAIRGLFSMASLMQLPLPEGLQARIDDLYETLLFYDEHTFGAAESVSDPTAENSMIQWGEKGSYVWEARKDAALLRETAMGWLQQEIPRLREPSITVFNTSLQERSGLARVYIEHELLPRGKGFRLTGPDGENVPAQPDESREDGTYWTLWVDHIPPMGYKTYKLTLTDDPPVLPAESNFTGMIENEHYRLEADSKTGGIRSLTDKDLSRDLAFNSDGWQTGQFIYERLTDRHQLELYKLEHPARRSGLTDVAFGRVSDGPLWIEASLTGQSPECASPEGVETRIRLYKPLKMIEIQYSMDKLPVTDPEAVYIAFPFQVPGGDFRYEAQGGWVNPGIDQIPGTASDWNTIQRVVSLSNPDLQVIMASPDIPLVHFGEINTGAFRRHYIPEKPALYSWVLNNYWVTNFNASQEGTLRWKYFLTSRSDRSDLAAARFGWDNHIPLEARVSEGGHPNGKDLTRSLFRLEDPGILLVSASPVSNGILLHMREIQGKESQLDLGPLLEEYPGSSVEIRNAIGEQLSASGMNLHFSPYEVKFIQLVLRKNQTP